MNRWQLYEALKKPCTADIEEIKTVTPNEAKEAVIEFIMAMKRELNEHVEMH